MGTQSPIRDLGPCQLVFDGVDLGETRGGCKFKFTEEDVDILEDVHGTNAVDSLNKGSSCELTAMLTRLTITQLSAILAGSSGSGTSLVSGKMLVKTAVGTSRYENAKTLIVKPIVEGVPSADTTEWLYIYRTAAVANFDVPYDIDNQRVFEVTFKAFPYHDAASGSRRRLWGIGTDGTA